MNFPELCRTCPSIAELKAAAVRVAQHESGHGFAYWLADSAILARPSTPRPGDRHGPQPSGEVVLTGFLMYLNARRRRAKTLGTVPRAAGSVVLAAEPSPPDGQ